MIQNLGFLDYLYKIEESDIDSVMATGVDGIAVSGALINASDTTNATKQMIEKLDSILNQRLSQKGLE